MGYDNTNVNDSGKMIIFNHHNITILVFYDLSYNDHV